MWRALKRNGCVLLCLLAVSWLESSTADTIPASPPKRLANLLSKLECKTQENRSRSYIRNENRAVLRPLKSLILALKRKQTLAQGKKKRALNQSVKALSAYQKTCKKLYRLPHSVPTAQAPGSGTPGGIQTPLQTPGPQGTATPISTPTATSTPSPTPTPFSLPTVFTPDFNLGEQKTLVLLLEWDNLPLEIPVEEIRAQVFGERPSLSDFIIENSGAQAWLSGEVLGPFNLGSTPPIDCSVGAEALQAVNLQVDLRQYKRLVFVRRGYPNCYVSTGFRPIMRDTPAGPILQSWSNIVSSSSAGFLGILIHEMGHSFGIDRHSCSLLCSGYAGDGLSSCLNTEGGNPFSIMGHYLSQRGHFTANRKGQIGWLAEEGESIAANTGLYYLRPLELAEGLREIKIPYGDFANFLNEERTYSLNYSLEYRQPLGYDSGYTFNNTNDSYGVHLLLAASGEGTEWFSAKEFLIDTKPETLHHFDAPMQAGDGYHDNVIGKSVNVLSANSDGAWVEVVSDPAGCRRDFPELSLLSLNPNGPIIAGNSVIALLKIKSTDTADCPASVVSFRPELPQGWTQLGPLNINLLPQEEKQIGLAIFVPSSVASDQYSLRIIAKNLKHFRYKTSLAFPLNVIAQ